MGHRVSFLIGLFALGSVGSVGGAGCSGCTEQASATVRDGDSRLFEVQRATPVPAPAPVSSEPPADLATLVERVQSVVVSIESSRITDGIDIPDLRELLEQQSGNLSREQAVGSGIIVAADGLVLTNEHVVHGAERIEVRLAGGHRCEASVVGSDAKLDVALIRLKNAPALPVALLGSSEAVRIGDRVVAIGNPFGLGASVSFGIVSAKARSIGTGPYDAFIQTDAAINPGNSGGPLFDMQGRVVGVTTVIHSRGRGLGFAIPIDDIAPLMEELRATGHVTRGRLGVSFQELDEDLARSFRLPEPRGALVSDVEPNGPASRAGVRPGDVVTAIDDRTIGPASDFARELGRRKPGQRVHLAVARRGDRLTFDVKLDRSTDEPLDERTIKRAPQTGTLGLRLSDASDGGAQVDEADPTGAMGERLEQGDVVLEANGKTMRKGADLAATITAASRPSTVLLRVRRGATIVYVAVPLPPP